MKIIKAKIIDPTHLELIHPITIQPGEFIKISIPDENEDERVWREAARKHFLEAYDDKDAIYDEL